jgi:hypothetical protein
MKKVGEVRTKSGRKLNMEVPETPEELAMVERLRDDGKIHAQASFGDFINQPGTKKLAESQK